MPRLTPRQCAALNVTYARVGEADTIDSDTFEVADGHNIVRLRQVDGTSYYTCFDDGSPWLCSKEAVAFRVTVVAPSHSALQVEAAVLRAGVEVGEMEAADVTFKTLKAGSNDKSFTVAAHEHFTVSIPSDRATSAGTGADAHGGAGACTHACDAVSSVSAVFVVPPSHNARNFTTFRVECADSLGSDGQPALPWLKNGTTLFRVLSREEWSPITKTEEMARAVKRKRVDELRRRGDALS